MNNQLLTQCGSIRVKLEDLLRFSPPAPTKSYTPLGHYDFAVNVLTIASDLLKGYRFDGDSYALSSDGQKMFGVITYRKINPGPNDELKVAIGLRNSYDKSMSAGLVIGSTVLVCDNLVFSGDVKVMRKHSGESMHEELHDQIVAAIYKSQHNFHQISEDVQAMKQRPMNQQQKYEFIGHLTGQGILSPSQSSAAYKELWRPSHEEFTTNTLWAGYNCATEALKSSPVDKIVQRHADLHALTKEVYLN